MSESRLISSCALPHFVWPMEGGRRHIAPVLTPHPRVITAYQAERSDSLAYIFDGRAVDTAAILDRPMR